MVSSNPYQLLYYNEPPLRSHTEPFCRHSPTTKSFGPLRGGFLYFPREFAAGLPACNSSYPHLESYMSRLDLDTAPRPRRNVGEPDNAAVTQGQERRFGTNGEHKQETLLFANTPQLLKGRTRFETSKRKMSRKAISKYRPVATISKIEIASH